MRFKLVECAPCFVTWTREIEANSLADAQEQAMDGSGCVVSTEIGDLLDAPMESHLYDDRGMEVSMVN